MVRKNLPPSHFLNRELGLLEFGPLSLRFFILRGSSGEHISH